MSNDEIIAECKYAIEGFFCKPRSSMTLQEAIEKINEVYEILDMDSKNNGWSITMEDGSYKNNVTMEDAVETHLNYIENEREI
jgi:hypothetical protein